MALISWWPLPKLAKQNSNKHRKKEAINNNKRVFLESACVCVWIRNSTKLKSQSIGENFRWLRPRRLNNNNNYKQEESSWEKKKKKKG